MMDRPESKEQAIASLGPSNVFFLVSNRMNMLNRISEDMKDTNNINKFDLIGILITLTELIRSYL